MPLTDNILDSFSPGIPIGSYTSQWFANFHLEGFDHFVKEKLGVKYYVRYVDDMVLFGRNKKELHRVRRVISEYLETLGLELKGNWQVSPVNSRPVDFLGYKLSRGRTELRSRNFLRARRRLAKIRKKGFMTERDRMSIAGYYGWLKHSDLRAFMRDEFYPVVRRYRC